MILIDWDKPKSYLTKWPYMWTALYSQIGAAWPEVNYESAAYLTFNIPHVLREISLKWMKVVNGRVRFMTRVRSWQTGLFWEK